MKKIFFVLLFFILTSTQTYAQFAVGVHGTGAYAFPAISSSSNGNIGYGGGANVMYFVNDQFSIGVNASYTNVMGINNSADYSLIGVAPSFMFLVGWTIALILVLMWVRISKTLLEFLLLLMEVH